MSRAREGPSNEDRGGGSGIRTNLGRDRDVPGAIAPGNRVPSRSDDPVRTDALVRYRLPDRAPRGRGRHHGELLQVSTSPPTPLAGSRPGISPGPVGRPPRADARPLDGFDAVPHGRDDPHDDPRAGPRDPRRAATRRAAGRHGADDLGRPPALLPIELYYWNRVRHVLFVSDAVRQEVLGTYGPRVRTSALIPNGLAFDELRAAGGTLDSPEEPGFILYTGRLLGWKGLAVLLRAMVHL